MFSWSRENRRSAALAARAAKSVYGERVETRTQLISQSANSTRIRVVVLQSDYPDLLVKVTRPTDVQGHLGPDISSLPSVSMQLQNRFRVNLPDWLRIPRVLLSDDSAGIVVMEYLHGTDLKQVLASKVAPKGFEMDSVAKLCGRALARWHSFWPADPVGNRADSSNVESSHVLSYLDFSVWNVRVDGEAKGIALLDVPGHKMFSRRHRDLASFLHSLLVVAHHPKSIILHPDWWDWRGAYIAFLIGYQDASEIPLTYQDLALIGTALRETVDRELANYKRRRPSLRYLVEGAWYSKLKEHAAFEPNALVSLLDHERYHARVNSAPTSESKR